MGRYKSSGMLLSQREHEQLEQPIVVFFELPDRRTSGSSIERWTLAPLDIERWALYISFGLLSVMASPP
jgi:hypothetical protein